VLVVEIFLLRFVAIGLARRRQWEGTALSRLHHVRTQWSDAIELRGHDDPTRQCAWNRGRVNAWLIVDLQGRGVCGRKIPLVKMAS
jgi:hypothetical protein